MLSTIDNIDFLPAEYRQRTEQRTNAWWRGMVVFAFLGVFVLAGIAQHGLRRRLERDLQSVRVEFEQVVAAQAETEQLAARLDDCRARAELLTYLRHPWPRTQLIATALGELPHTVALHSVRLTRDAPVHFPQMQSEQVASLAALRPVRRDLQRLRAEADAAPTTLTLEGTTEDILSLHVYLGRLAQSPLFAKAELQSIENPDGESGGASLFNVLLVVRPGWGQHGGPTRESRPVSASAAAPAAFKPRMMQ